MHAVIDAKHLHTAVSDAVKCLDRRSSLEWLTCVLVTAGDGTLSVAGAGYGAMVSSWPAATGSMTGTVHMAVDAAKFLKAVTVFKNDGDLTLTFEQDKLVIGTADGESLSFSANREFTSALREYMDSYLLRDDYCLECPVDYVRFVQILADAEKFAATEETRTYLRGVWMHADAECPDKWKVMATDGHTLLRVNNPFEDTPRTRGVVMDRFLLDRDALVPLLRTIAVKGIRQKLSHLAGDVRVFPYSVCKDVSRRGHVRMHLRYVQDDTASLIACVDLIHPDGANMPDYTRIIAVHEQAVEHAERGPSTDDETGGRRVSDVVGKITVSVDDLHKRLDRVMKIRGKDATVVLGAAGDAVRLASAHDDVTYDAEVHGGMYTHYDTSRVLHAGFRAEYLAKALDVLKWKVTIWLSPNAPNGLKATGNPDYFVVLMPLRVDVPSAWTAAG